jgi:hypothetical protein
MRPADVRTTLKVYAHVIRQSQRDSMERIAHRSIRDLASAAVWAALKARIDRGAMGCFRPTPDDRLLNQ